MSKSTVSRVCEEIQAQFQAWSARRLDDVELNYLFLDGSHFKYHANASAEPVLAAWGIDTDGNLIFSYTTPMTGTDAPVLSAAVYAVSPPISRANPLACNAEWRTAASWRRREGGRWGVSMWTTTSRPTTGSPGQAMSRWWPISRPVSGMR